MTTSPDHVPPADRAEQRHPADDDPVPALPQDLPDDAPEADALEQAQPTSSEPQRVPGDLPLEADDADAAEQSHVVPLDEDEAREQG